MIPSFHSGSLFLCVVSACLVSGFILARHPKPTFGSGVHANPLAAANDIADFENRVLVADAVDVHPVAAFELPNGQDRTADHELRVPERNRRSPQIDAPEGGGGTDGSASSFPAM
jgi:hypothetical protein